MISSGLPGALLRFLGRMLSLFFKKLHSRVIVSGENMEIRSGIIIRRRLRFLKSQIKCIVIEQTVFMQMIKMYSLQAVIRGENSSRDKKIVFLPICTLAEAEVQRDTCLKDIQDKKDLLYLIGRNWLRKKQIYCLAEDIGQIKLSDNPLSRGCKFKFHLRSQTKTVVKVRFPDSETAKKYLSANFFEFPEHNNTK